MAYVAAIFSGLLLVPVYIVSRILLIPLSSLFDYVSVMLLTDSQRLQTLSSPLIQVRLDDDKESFILTHAPSVHYPAHPLCWANPTASSTSALLPHTLFFIRFIPTTASSKVDRCHLALGVSPNNWLCLDPDTCHVGLSSDVSTASVFSISSTSSWEYRKPPSYIISVADGDDNGKDSTDPKDKCVLALYKESRRAAFINLSASATKSAAKESANDQPIQTSITLQYIPLSPALCIPNDLNVDRPSSSTMKKNSREHTPRTVLPMLSSGQKSIPDDDNYSNYDGDNAHIKNELDVTMSKACQQVRSVHLRLYNVGKRTFVVSKPDCAVRAATASDHGWDVFRMDRYPDENAGRLFDSSSTPLHLTTLGKKQSAFGLMGSGQAVPTHDSNTDGERLDVDVLRFDDMNETRANAVALHTRKGYLSMASVTGRNRDITIIPEKNCVDEEWRLYLALPSDNEIRVPRVTVTGMKNGIRRVRGEMQVMTTLDLAYDVITDYSGFKHFLNDIIDGEIVETHTPTNFTVRMVQSHTFLMLTIPMSMTLRVQQYPSAHKVDLELISGVGIKYYKGTWSVVPVNQDGQGTKHEGAQQCRVSCVIDAATLVPAPGFLLDNLMSHAAETNLKQLQEECKRRELLREKS